MTLALASASPPREKSPEAFRTISEVSAELDVPQHVLRFWETRFAQVKPVKRAGGRRYYRPDDVDLLRGIRSLLYSEGYTIKGVQKVLRERGLRHVAGIGRGEARLPGGSPAMSTDLIDGEPRYARAALARLEQAHESGDIVPGLLDERRQVKLEILLAELLVLKERLQSGKLSA
jgi:DNA-binding transcriptional MerR regulator